VFAIGACLAITAMAKLACILWRELLFVEFAQLERPRELWRGLF
jgi:hypothetical protein